MKTLITSDLHLGAKRSGGTTLTSAEELKGYLQLAFRTLIMQHTDKHLVINGDLLDAFQAEPLDIMNCFNTMGDWLALSQGNLTLIAGNHDCQPRGVKVSSFHLLCHFLTAQHKDRVTVIDWDAGFTEIRPGLYVIPHMQNQDLFNAEIEKAIESGSEGHLLLHCNYCNPFAEQADHSLNLNHEQTVRLTQQFTLVLGHEHQRRVGFEGLVQLVGNPFPSSIADCLSSPVGQQDGRKYAVVLGSELEFIETWNSKADYTAIDWRDLGPTEAKFIRVGGDATADEAAAVVNAIAKYRQSSLAFIVSNAVRVEGCPTMEGLAETSAEAIKSFDVLQVLLQELTSEEAAFVKELINA